ncbi:MAG TPA: phytanoyl-CoA dioxygenase family protein [Microvirga sp.]|jgi:hypothetical protein
MARTGILAADNTIASNVWIDRPDAPSMIEAKLKAREINEEEASILSRLWTDGYVVFPSGLPDSFFERTVAGADALWQQRNDDLLCADPGLNNGRPMPQSMFPADQVIRPGCRMLDAHSHLPEFLELTALPRLHRIVDLLLGEKCVATQSLYFKYGSTQNAHRDPWFVVTTPISTLFAAWIALEDIAEESGPLSYVPGSHRLPYLPLNTGDIIFHDPAATQESKEAHMADLKRQLDEKGLKEERFLAKRGEILIWHGSLVHGGSPVTNPSKTRQSYVLHFDAVPNHHRSAQTIKIGDNPPRVVETRDVLERNGSLYFGNPCAGKTLAQITGIGLEEPAAAPVIAAAATQTPKPGLLSRLFGRG